jgi:phospholipid transport system substrate-binding protein
MVRHVLAPALLLAAFASHATAGEPSERLRTFFDDANRILMTADADTALEDRVAAVRALVNDVFDAREAAALALGHEWHARTSAEREEFARLYAGLVERAYLGWIGSRARVNGDGVRVTFLSEWIRDETASVSTSLQTRGGGEMAIEYRLTRREGRWAVRDVVVDGLSLADSYRAQFQRVLQTGSYADLIARLHERGVRKPVLAARAEPTPVRVASATPVSDAPPLLTPVVSGPAASGGVSSLPTPPAAAAVGPPANAGRPGQILTAPLVVNPRPAAVTAPPVVAPPVTLARAAPEVRSVLPAARKWFWIQVGAFRDTDAASRLVERLRNHSVMVATGGARTEPLARVLVGPFSDRTAAASTLRELSARGYRAFIAVE